MIKNVICHKCGSVNRLETDKLFEQTEEEDWLICDQPENFEWRLPAGKITPVIGDPIYITGSGAHLSRNEYIERYGIDPEIALKMMRQMGRAVAETLRAGQDMTVEEVESRLPSAVRRIISRLNRNWQDNPP